MPRSAPHRRSVHTRLATPDDAAAAAKLWSELRDLGERAERAVNPVTVADAVQRFKDAIDALNCDVILAQLNGELAGLAVVRIIQPDPLSPTRLLQLSHLVVDHSVRRRGIGHALLAAVSDYAADSGVDHVAASIYPSLRDASRFLARLGFAPLAVERVAPVTALQRRLGIGGVVEDRVRRRGRVRASFQVSRRSHVDISD